jgi:pyruvate dehydrogenase E1 component alpha subunit
MAKIRLFEERIVDLYAEQEMKTPVHLCIGQEAVATGVCAHLRQTDFIFSTHRSHGHCIAKGMDLKPIAAELYGRDTGCSRGRGGSMHLVDAANGIPGSTAIVGGGIPLAVGAALSAKLQHQDRVAVAFFGDGATEEGTFHESLNFAALHKLPVLFVCENNFYATNSPQRARQPSVTIAEKGHGYGIPSRSLDGNDIMLVYETAGEAIERARRGEGPTLLEYQTYRWKGHVGPSCDVEMGCRPQDEYDQWVARCPYDFFRLFLIKSGNFTENDLDAIDSVLQDEIAEAMRFGKESPYPDPATLFDYVY